jgi:hypothetical protein
VIRAFLEFHFWDYCFLSFRKKIHSQFESLSPTQTLIQEDTVDQDYSTNSWLGSRKFETLAVAHALSY